MNGPTPDYNPNEAMTKMSAGGIGPMGYEKPTMKQTLLQKKAAYEIELAKVNAALDALTSDPKLEGILEAISKALW